MIRLQFVDERWPFYKLTTWGTHGNVCHVDAVLRDGTLRGARSI